MKLLVKNIGQLVTVVEGGEVCLAGKGMGQIKVGRRVLPIREINADIASRVILMKMRNDEISSDRAD